MIEIEKLCEKMERLGRITALKEVTEILKDKGIVALVDFLERDAMNIQNQLLDEKKEAASEPV